jgi:hypothetical protein
VSYHGISGLYNSNYVDGANNNQALFSEARGRASGAPYVYSLDSIQEFQVDSAVYSAEFGQAAGGQVNAITRSGTNSMHGDLFYFLRYPALNALDSYNKSKGIITQAVRQQQQFGGSAGGPIRKDRLFYFFTYDGFRKVAPIAYSSTAEISQTPITTSSTSTITPAQWSSSPEEFHLQALPTPYVRLSSHTALHSDRATLSQRQPLSGESGGSS